MRDSLPSARRDFLASVAAGGVAAALTLSGSAKALGIASLRLSNADWRKRLSPAAFAVLREAATERPFSSPLNHEHRRGVFACAGCALPLYLSATKFDSGTGWPSFYDHLPRAIETRADTSIGMARTEVRCARCEGHLGHVFPDGPPPTSLRYCMNGVALQFRPA
ncbi:MAG TPA: peptide-methionine (R)-S-oxide reductase MsrB [Sphingomicrobium sp.]|nr:peptide-methionine (R)-S-oxide reductase MsrB [Sphingomicrobium sp.]